MIRLKKQNDTIQQRIYVHYDIIRNYYGIHQAGSVGAALALLLASAVLIFITGDIWEGKIQKKSAPDFTPHSLWGHLHLVFEFAESFVCRRDLSNQFNSIYWLC